jgi:hypothetical protein
VDKIAYTLEEANSLTSFYQAVTEISASVDVVSVLDNWWSYRSFRLYDHVGASIPRGPAGFCGLP